MNTPERKKIVFVSNYYNHHQAELACEMNRLTDGGYAFVETAAMQFEQKALGWGQDEYPDFVCKKAAVEANMPFYQQLMDDAEYVLVINELDRLMEGRHRSGKLVFRYSERFYKKGFPLWKAPLRYVKNRLLMGRYKNDYLLCAGAYTAADAVRTGCFKGKTYKWGYFPEFEELDESALMASKNTECPVILWAGRLIDWKHPELAVELADTLKRRGLRFRLDIIGRGEMEAQLRELIAAKGLSDCANLLGAVPARQVREHMKAADIFISTSDYNEGWGAVVNEAMNSGCAVVASHAVGSAPFLIENGENGFIYQNGNTKDLCDKVELLLKDDKLRHTAGLNAYQTIAQTWNARVAAERFLIMAEEIKKTGGCDLFEDGPCSRAEVIY